MGRHCGVIIGIKTTTVDDIYRVANVRSGRARGYGFFFDDRKAMLGWDGGLALTRSLAERNPNIQQG
jgi:hypothetical protein